MNGTIFLIIGPSGAGKSTLINEVKRGDDKIAETVSWTTREKRHGEVDGKNYRFVTKGLFNEGIRDGAFVEYCSVHGNFYGTPINAIDDQLKEGKDVIIEVDAVGATRISLKYKNAVKIFITPPSFHTMMERLQNRDTETRETLQKRVTTAIDEIRTIDHCKYVINNANETIAALELKCIITAHRSNPHLQKERIERYINDFHVAAFKYAKNHWWEKDGISNSEQTV